MSTKERILESALAVFAERGADGGSMREIARRAGVNVATAYHHFGSKRELILEIFRELGFVDAPEVDDWPMPGGSPQESLEQLLFWSWLWMRSGTDVVRLAVMEAMKGDEEVLPVLKRWQVQGDARISKRLLEHGLADETNVERRTWTVRQVIWATFVEELMYKPWSDEELIRFSQESAAALLESWA